MNELSRFRLILLRATYLLLVVGLGLAVWPGVLRHSSAAALRWGFTWSLLAAVGLLALVGLLHPVKMLPLLLFELVWKTIWLAAFALPLVRAGEADAQTWQSIRECGLGLAILPPVIPWPHVWRTYVRAPWERSR